MNTFFEGLELLGDGVEYIKRFSTEGALVIVLGTLIDIWSRDHNLTPEQSMELVEKLQRLHKHVNSTAGGMNND